MLVREMIKLGTSRLTKAHCMDPKIDAEELYCHLTKADRVRLFLSAEETVDEQTQTVYFELIEKRAERIPLQHIIGTQEFMGLKFLVNSHVLIPRQDTEVLVEETAKIINGANPSFKSRRTWKVLDLCCGSGAIGVSLAKICPNTKITGIDVSPEAINQAQLNAAKNRVKVKYLAGDLFEPVRKKKFDMIVANPPYIRTNMIPILQDEVKVFEPLLALDGGVDGLDFYRRIIAQAPDYLTKHGVLGLEIGHDQADDVTELIKKEKAFTKVHRIKDTPGNDRVILTRTLY